ncbi:MAG: patatin-like phospholipase family protein [Candidatus Omnitrophota bacterium]
MSERIIKILSIDGGGIRGIIPATILARIEKRTQRPISELFDIVAGTSTGGILALSLTQPGADKKPRYSAQELVRLYQDEGPNIFSRSFWHKLKSPGNLLEEKYPAAGIEGVLGKHFGLARLKDALTDTIITAYDLERRAAFFFKSHKAKEDKEYDFLLKDVARATSSAPTFFEPVKIAKNERDYYAMVDGGVFANNPAMCAYAEALNKYPDIPRDNFLLVSLGTGEATRRIAFDAAKRWGSAQWARPLLGVMFDGISDTIDYQLRRIFSSSPENYCRFQASLYQGNEDMDDVSPENLRALKILGEELAEKETQALDKICRRLS